MTAAVLVLALVTAQRLGELALARRNTLRLLARGGVESGAGHYPLIVGLHTAWLLGLWALAWNRPIEPAWLLVYIGLLALRAWVLLTLGGRWTTRIITIAGERPVTHGPYRFVSHPNYLVVAGEIAVLPLVFGLWAFAIVFSILNVMVLAIRLKAERRAWRTAKLG